MNQELISQGLTGFNLFTNFGSDAPRATGNLLYATDEGGAGDNIELVSVTPTNDPQAVPFEAEGTMGLAALGGFFWYRNRKKRKQTLAASAKSE
ncbi:hypothetical protein PCC7418_3782 [Halothece sp. PCC 7418]|nr:hypothetical protein PCC7418_3782 [Halothece sp. PCC 7418]